MGKGKPGPLKRYVDLGSPQVQNRLAMLRAMGQISGDLVEIVSSPPPPAGKRPAVTVEMQQQWGLMHKHLVQIPGILRMNRTEIAEILKNRFRLVMKPQILDEGMWRFLVDWIAADYVAEFLAEDNGRELGDLKMVMGSFEPDSQEAITVWLIKGLSRERKANALGALAQGVNGG